MTRSMLSILPLSLCFCSCLYGMATVPDVHVKTPANSTISEKKKPEKKILTKKKKNASRVIDEVRVVISNGQETVLVLTSDIRPTLDGTPRTLRNVVLEQLMVFEAQKLKITITDDDIDRYLSQLRKMNNCTLDQLKVVIEKMGYTYEQAREQLRNKEYIDRLFDERVRSDKRLMVNARDVEEYWQKNPEKEEATFTLACARIQSSLDQKTFEDQLGAGTFEGPIDWDKPFVLKESELAPEKKFLTTKHAGDIVLVEPIEHGYECTKLVAKTDEKVLPLVTGDVKSDKQRYAEIERAIKIERFQSVVHDYEQSLLAHAHLECTHEVDHKALFNPEPDA